MVVKEKAKLTPIQLQACARVLAQKIHALGDVSARNALTNITERFLNLVDENQT
jgi:hypothetical protein